MKNNYGIYNQLKELTTKTEEAKRRTNITNSIQWQQQTSIVEKSTPFWHQLSGKVYENYYKWSETLWMYLLTSAKWLDLIIKKTFLLSIWKLYNVHVWMLCMMNMASRLSHQVWFCLYSFSYSLWNHRNQKIIRKYSKH